MDVDNEFYESEMTTVPDDVMEEMRKEEEAFYKKKERNIKRMFRAIANVLGTEFLITVCHIMFESERWSELEIVREPIGKFQKEYGFERIDGYWVDQHSYGDGGDSYYGTICILLKEGRWLKFSYEM